MKFRTILFVLCFYSVLVFAQSNVTLIIDSNRAGREIPKDFLGESFETASIRINNRGVKGYFFDSTNKQLINLFKSLGLKSLRIGGGTVDNKAVNPTHDDIDALFRFAKAAGVKVIYSLKLLNGNPEHDASDAKYIWDHYKNDLDCFAIGNEPDWHSYHIQDPKIFETTSGEPGTAFPSYIKEWRRFAKTVLDSVPEAKFSGPNTGSNYPVPNSKNTGYEGKTWTENFIDAEKNSGIISFFTQHNYVGESTNDKTGEEVIQQMLSSEWDSVNYPALFNAVCLPCFKAGFPIRFTESNCFSEGINGANNTFATALYALDYLHWWAAHNVLGINFHTTQWRYNATFRMDEEGSFHINPMGYGIAAFNVGGHGKITPVEISNPDNLNITAYAVKDKKEMYVTIINKEYGSNAHEARVNIKLPGYSKNGYVMFMKTPDNNVTAMSGMTLGGAAITNQKIWEGKWTPLKSENNGSFKLSVTHASAAIIKILKN